MKVDGTPYSVSTSPVFGSTRWRFMLTAPGATGPVVSAAPQSTFESEAKARAAGEAYARAMIRQLRKDLGT